MGTQELIREAWLNFDKKPVLLISAGSKITKYSFSCFLPEVNILVCFCYIYTALYLAVY